MLRLIGHATRGLARPPGFAIAVVFTLALRIGAKTAIFSIVEQVLLRPLPYPNDDELVTIYAARRISSGHRSVHPSSSIAAPIDISPCEWSDRVPESR